MVGLIVLRESVLLGLRSALTRLVCFRVSLVLMDTAKTRVATTIASLAALVIIQIRMVDAVFAIRDLFNHRSAPALVTVALLALLQHPAKHGVRSACPANTHRPIAAHA